MKMLRNGVYLCDNQVIQMIHTIIVDVFDEDTMRILRDMELQKKIRLHNDHKAPIALNWISEFKGAMTPQNMDVIDAQLKEIRNGWD